MKNPSPKSVKKISTIDVGEYGRVHSVDFMDYNVHELYCDSTGLEGDALDAHMDDEEAFDAGLKAFEERFLRDKGVTHVIDFEDFGDRAEHTLEEFLALGSDEEG